MISAQDVATSVTSPFGGEVGAQRRVRGPSSAPRLGQGPLTLTLSPEGEGTRGRCRFTPRLLSSLLPLAASLLLSGAAFSAEIKIGYLGLKDDPRYHPDLVYTRIEIAPGGNPVDGATMGVEEMKVVSDAVDQQVMLDHQEATDAASLVAKLDQMVKAGEQFVILDLPAELVDQVAGQTREWPVTLLNATAPEDYLRQRCYPNLLHTAASDRMLSDAMVQLLRTRNWTKVLMLVGAEPRDKAMAHFERFAQLMMRFRRDVSFVRTGARASFRAPDPIKAAEGFIADYDAVVAQLTAEGVEPSVARSLAGIASVGAELDGPHRSEDAP